MIKASKRARTANKPANEAKRRMIGKVTVCAKISKGLREFGYPDCTTNMVLECFDAWIKNRAGKLPHGVIGVFVKKQLDELEEARPGALAQLD